MAAETLFTIGFTQKSAERFFALLTSNSVRVVLDTRLNNTGQLAGFAKKQDLSYFLSRLLQVRYVHWLESAPTEELLTAYKKKKLDWNQYEREYRDLIAHRRVDESDIARNLDSSCLLCSEAKPHKCHRRVLAEFLSEKAPGSLLIKHLV